MKFFVCGFLALLLQTTCLALETTLGGDITYENFYYWQKLSDPTRTVDHIFYLRPQLDLKLNRKYQIHLKPILRFNSSTEETPERLFLNVQEAYWEAKGDTVRVKLGQNVYHWGVLDGYSTMDVVNGRVLFNPLFADKRGAPTVDVQYDAGPLQIQALYIPVQARTLFPSADSRWLPREVLVNASSEQETVLLPTSFKYYYPGTQELDNALKHNYGLRFSGRHEDIDAALVYFEGSSITPQVRPILEADVVSIQPNILLGKSDIGLIPVYYRQRTAGLSLIWAPSDFVFKFESTYISTISKDPIVPPWLWQSGLGVEYPWSIGETTITFVAQGYHGENKDLKDNMLSSSTRLFDNAGLLAARVAFPSDTNLLLSSVFDFASGGNYMRFQLDRKFYDHFKMEFMGDFLQGKSGSLLGTYTKNDRLNLRISYLW